MTTLLSLFDNDVLRVVKKICAHANVVDLPRHVVDMATPPAPAAAPPPLPATSAAELPLVSRLRFEKLEREYPSLSPTFLFDVFAASGGDLDVTRASVAEMHPDVQRVATQYPVVNMDRARRQMATGWGRKNGPGSDWLATGEAVASLYADMRKEAAQWAKVRNRCYMQAAAVFKGDRALASRLSRQGTEAAERMKELHLKAARKILRARNPDLESTAARDTVVLDLHGLHVAEAADVLDEYLPFFHEMDAARRPRAVVVVTGSGHHSAHAGRLAPKVEAYLGDNRWVFDKVQDSNRYVGAFRVDMQRS